MVRLSWRVVMSFKRALTITFSLLITILLGLVVTMKSLSNAIENVATTEHERYESRILAHRLQQSSENLTRMARSYIATGDAVYKQRFHQILAIRSGTLHEPMQYSKASWGWEMPGTYHTTMPGTPVSIEDRVKKANCTEQEITILRECKQLSDLLAEIEISAMDAIDLGIKDPDYTVDGKTPKEWAEQQVYGESYRSFKEAILTQVDHFIQSIEYRTANDVAKARSQQRAIHLLTWVLAFFAVALCVAAYFQITRRVVNPISSISKQAEQVSQGNYSSHPEIQSYSEIKSLALSFNQMTSAIQRDLRRRDKDHKELVATKHAVEVAYGRMKKDLEAAAKVQRSLLPEVMPEAPGFDFAYSYLPCEELAGDTLNVLDLDDDHIALYLVDVSGHGVQAALLAATLSHVLSPIRHESSVIWSTDQSTDTTYVTPPVRVAEQLNTLFPYDPELNQYFTLHYGVLNKSDLTYRFVSCGHPKPVLLRHNHPPQTIQAKGPGIGLLPAPVFEEKEIQLTASDRIFFFSDGVLEAPNNQGMEFQENGLYSHIQQHLDVPIKQHIQQIFKDVLEWSGGQKLDDISAVAIEVRPEVN
ncbi:HAMP domain-containing protein [Rubritalea squalenifaciens DSM 18772]|uniref:HAMP domain-containing protein n=2 Tax=Rubritalea squalenifaciens TaxID=407226 RepID=A0A1M6AZQ9_9BACT|nr:HAMP domain-containing protein [Rubritalea squalenifaciens DSM 18772]